MKDLIKLYLEGEPAGGGGAAVAEPPVAANPDPAGITKPGSAAATVDINTPDPAAAKPETFVLPDAYRDKPYLKGVDSQEKLLKMLDGAQELIGKKTPVIPKADAPQAEKDAYYEALGRPKTAAEYTPVLTGADKTDPKVLPRLQNAFHKAGLTPDQAKIVWDESTAAFSDFAKEKGIADAQADTDFDKLAVDSFGVERDAVLARGKELISQLASPNMKDHVAKLPNESLIILADILRNVDKKFIRPDGPGSKPALNGQTPDELRMKARTIMEQQTKLSPMSAEWNALQKQVDDIYNTIRTGSR